MHIDTRMQTTDYDVLTLFNHGLSNRWKQLHLQGVPFTHVPFN